ncbi:MAG: hypothetical protein ACU0AT_13365 [Tranquillimonas sp.]|jgi:hypothetical protein
MADTDIWLVLGLAWLALALPAAVSAYSDGRPPRLAALLTLAGAVLVVFALSRIPGGGGVSDIPHAVVRVIGAALN